MKAKELYVIYERECKDGRSRRGRQRVIEKLFQDMKKLAKERGANTPYKIRSITREISQRWEAFARIANRENPENHIELDVNGFINYIREESKDIAEILDAVEQDIQLRRSFRNRNIP